MNTDRRQPKDELPADGDPHVHHDCEHAPPGAGLDSRGELQLQLSMLVDGELDETAAGRAIAELESCPDSRDFFDSIRAQIRLHRELQDTESLRSQYAELVGCALPRDMETRQAVHRLAEIFYQLGKAYALSAHDPDYRTRVFEEAVAVDSTRARGRGFVDGVAHREGGEYGGFDWRAKRHLLNGTLEKIEEPLVKARRLLDEALLVEPDNEPAQLYLGFLDAREGRKIAAAKRFRKIFDEAIEEGHRGHAATQLGVLHAEEGSWREALVWYRWIGMSGLADLDPRFFVAKFSAGVCYVHLGQRRRALETFRSMLDRYPERTDELAGFFARSPVMQREIDAQPGFPDELAATCPELFGHGQEEL